ncbi:MAG: gamma-glutamyl-gamma-aminobutyrate hydrolase family protein [Alphaproteobacteria bacterium]|nr:gamma-glutamyl-gamma-aminobutyrate hydrolase family protein [Alphaproteobacteria bacterium]
MTRGIVAVSQRIDDYPERGEYRDALDQQLCVWIARAGFVPVQVPNRLGDDAAIHAWLHAVSPAGIVLSGGADVGKHHDRDRTEGVLLEHAKAFDLPLLGICRGMQFLALQFGAQLVEREGHVRIRHRLIPRTGEKIPATVNSYHTWTLTECPSMFQTLATCEADGTIEAFAHTNLPWEGWMWHPERESPFAEADHSRFEILFGGSGRPQSGAGL